MAVAPGTNPGDTTLINGVEYTWDGVSWNKNSDSSLVFSGDPPVTVDVTGASVHHGFDLTLVSPL